MDLRNKPFFLDQEGIDWVEKTLQDLSTEEKIGQLFCPVGMNPDLGFLQGFIEEFHPGAMMYRPLPSQQMQQVHGFLQKQSKVPMLLGANLESGGNGICADGTYFSRPLGVAATDNEEQAYRLGLIAGREAQAVGCNWAFAPICDIDMNFRNPITNVRTYGSDQDRVLRFVKKQLQGLLESNVVSAVKHFPGDGVDERDQHLLSSVNSLSVEEYDQTYGKIWSALVEEGIKSVMVGHIMQPAYCKHLNPELRDEEILPATLSPELLQGLLRGKMGFNGLIVTDATPMVGYCVAMSRKDALPASIMAGCDMILFNKDIREDYQAMRDALADGRLTMERVDEAVTRILGMKASMRLHKLQENEIEQRSLKVVACEEHKQWAAACADQGITLVKDTQHLLPISPEKYKRIRLYLLEDRLGEGFKDGENQIGLIQKLLENDGFEVNVYDYAHPNFQEMFEGGVDDIKSKFDLAIYVACLDTASNQTTRRIEWMRLMAADAPWFVNDVPALFVSVANPYHLVDVPMIKTFINAYTPSGEVLEKVVDKLMGKSQFQGINPVDPFCGVWGTQF